MALVIFPQPGLPAYLVSGPRPARSQEPGARCQASLALKHPPKPTPLIGKPLPRRPVSLARQVALRYVTQRLCHALTLRCGSLAEKKIDVHRSFSMGIRQLPPAFSTPTFV